MTAPQPVGNADVSVSGNRRPTTSAEIAPEDAALVGLVPQEWCPGGNRCMKPTKTPPGGGRTGRADGRCRGRARWCDTAAAERYDRYVIGTEREPGPYAYKVCNRHARQMIEEARHG